MLQLEMNLNKLYMISGQKQEGVDSVNGVDNWCHIKKLSLQ